MTTVTTGPALTPTTPPRHRGPNGWLVVGGIFTVLVLVTGALSVAGWLGYRTETQQAVYERTVSDLSIEVATGDITLIVGAADQVTVTRRLHWSFEKPTITERWEGETLVIDGGCRYVWLGPSCRVDYTLAVPADVTIRAHTSTGDISATAFRGSLYLSTSTGDIEVTGATGGLNLRTSTGDISVLDATAKHVSASTSTGDIRLQLAASPLGVSARTSTGDIQITLPPGQAYQVKADTSTGEIRVDVDRDFASTRVVIAKTSTGDIAIRYGPS